MDRKAFSLFPVAFVYLFLYLPITVLVLFSFSSAQFPAPWGNFTIHWYKELFADIYLWKAFGTSIIIATASTLISTLAGTGLIFYASQGGRVGRYLGLFYGNIIIPETVLAVSLLSFFATIRLPLGVLTLILAHSVLSLGFVVPLLYARYKEIDPRLTEASTDLGARPIQTFLRVILPLLRPTLIVTSLLVFILSFDDFILSYFCAGSTAQTLSLYILALIRTSASPVINALSTLMLTFSSLMVILFFTFRARSRL